MMRLYVAGDGSWQWLIQLYDRRILANARDKFLQAFIQVL